MTNTRTDIVASYQTVEPRGRHDECMFLYGKRGDYWTARQYHDEAFIRCNAGFFLGKPEVAVSTVEQAEKFFKEYQSAIDAEWEARSPRTERERDAKEFAQLVANADGETDQKLRGLLKDHAKQSALIAARQGSPSYYGFWGKNIEDKARLAGIRVEIERILNVRRQADQAVQYDKMMGDE